MEKTSGWRTYIKMGCLQSSFYCLFFLSVIKAVDSFCWLPCFIFLNTPGNAVLYEQRSSSEASQVTQNDCLPTGNGVVVEPVAINYYQEGPQWLPANPTNEISQSTVAFPVSHAQQNFPGTNQFNQLGE